MKTVKPCFYLLICLCLPLFSLYPQAARENIREPSMGTETAMAASIELPLKRIAILSSGVGYYEHRGNVSGPADIPLSFDSLSINDALKSLVVNDPSSSSPSVHYAAQNTLELTLKSLKIDISGLRGIGDILDSLKGAELIVSSPNPIRGRIIGVEYRRSGGGILVEPYGYPPSQSGEEAWLSIYTVQGIRTIAVKDISTFRFVDESINDDLNRALDLIMASRDRDARNLLVTLNGSGSRTVSLSYVIPTPVWKVSYRLDLSGREPLLQGWAIVDNDSDVDWKGVELSLVTGKPVSFIQNLYPPYRLSRPVVPLAIAGIAESRTYESGYGYADSAVLGTAAKEFSAEMDMVNERMALQRAPMPQAMPSAPPAVTGGVVETASGRSAGDQFEFTLKNAVYLERRQSAMLPLVEGNVRAEKTLVLPQISQGMTFNPYISVELTNSSGMKLPAGPITVYDGGTYSGDALIEFFPENEKRLISYGQDLSVTGNMTSSGSRYVTGVNVSGGVMVISRRQSYEKVYSIRNASEENKKIIIEHQITSGSELTEPKSAEDRTAALYRFYRNLPAKETLSLNVKEEIPVSESIVLAQLRPETFLSYSTNQEIPANVRAVLSRAIELKKTADDAASAQGDLETQKSRLVSEQDRIRRNLEAAGNQSPQGQDYLRRLASLDSDIDKINSDIDAAVRETQRAKREYDNYLSTINI